MAQLRLAVAELRRPYREVLQVAQSRIDVYYAFREVAVDGRIGYAT
jgi:hypothetical protein